MPQRARDYRQQANWSALEPLLNIAAPAVLNLTAITNALTPLLESESFATSTIYDALNRPISVTMPDHSEVLPTYNEANLLEKLDVRLRGATHATTFVKNLDYNAKGQRELIEYGTTGSTTNVSTTYTYDPFTFRMTELKTTRTKDNALLQDLSYTYDPVDNITESHDDAQQTIFFNNA